MVGERRRERYKRRGRWWERGEERGIREEGVVGERRRERYKRRGGGRREEKRDV